MVRRDVLGRRITHPVRDRGHGWRGMLTLLRLLGSGRWQASPLAGELSVSVRTVYRMIESLVGLGLAVERQREGRETYYRIDRDAITRWIDNAARARVTESRARAATTRPRA